MGRMRALRTLCLVKCHRRTPEDVQAPDALWRGYVTTVAAGNMLHRLSIRGTGYNAEGCTALAQADDPSAGAGFQRRSGRSLNHAAACHMSSLAPKPLKHLNLAEIHLGEAGCELLFPVLQTMTTLRTIDLTDKGLEAGPGGVVRSLPVLIKYRSSPYDWATTR